MIIHFNYHKNEVIVPRKQKFKKKRRKNSYYVFFQLFKTSIFQSWKTKTLCRYHYCRLGCQTHICWRWILIWHSEICRYIFVCIFSSISDICDCLVDFQYKWFYFIGFRNLFYEFQRYPVQICMCNLKEQKKFERLLL